jgi:hypothetical protein
MAKEEKLKKEECQACYHVQVIPKHYKPIIFSRKRYTRKSPFRPYLYGIQCQGCGHLIELPPPLYTLNGKKH